MTNIAVLMTCYNRVGVTRNCIEKLFAQKKPEGWNLDIWLVDDASPDCTGAIVKNEFPSVNIIKGTGSLYWAKGMWLAWNSASSKKDYDAYLWLNDDVQLFDNALETLVHDLRVVENPSACVFMGACESGGGDVSYSARLYDGNRAVPNGKVPMRFRDMMSGNFVFVPRDVLKRVGMIYKGYSHAYGDFDYALKCERAGIKKYCCSRTIGICPQQPDRYSHLKGKNIMQRIKLLFDPKGFSLYDTILFRVRNFGLLRAIVSMCHVLLIVIFAIEKEDSK